MAELRASAFIDRQTGKPIENGVFYCSTGPDYELWVVKRFSGKKFKTFEGKDGKDVKPSAELLVETTGLPLLDGSDLYYVEVPLPDYCVGCGRRLMPGTSRCPFLAVNDMEQHETGVTNG